MAHTVTGQITPEQWLLQATIVRELLTAVREGSTRSVAAEAVRRAFADDLPAGVVEAEIERVERVFDFEREAMVQEEALQS